MKNYLEKLEELKKPVEDHIHAAFVNTDTYNSVFNEGINAAKPLLEEAIASTEIRVREEEANEYNKIIEEAMRDKVNEIIADIQTMPKKIDRDQLVKYLQA